MKNIIEILEAQTIDLDLVYAYTNGATFSEFEEEVHTLINETEVIYYSRAIAYIQQEDPSMRECLELASDLGYETDSLNSEVLATLLKQQRLNEEWSEISSEIEEAFDEWSNHLSEAEDRQEEIEERIEEINALSLREQTDEICDERIELESELDEIKVLLEDNN